MLFSATAVLAVFGAVRGLSGQTGTLAGLAAGLVAGYFLFPCARHAVLACGFSGGAVAVNAAAGVVDFTASAVIFALTRMIVAKFFSFLIPQPMDALLGAFAGMVKGVIATGVLCAAGLVQTGRFSEGFFASHSSLVKAAGAAADSYVSGAVGEASK